MHARGNSRNPGPGPEPGPPGRGRRPRAMDAAAVAITALLALSITAFAPEAAQRELPERFEATFVLEAKGTTFARTRWSLVPGADGTHVSTSRTEPAGMFALIRDDTRVERSVWTWAGDSLQPLAYDYERTGGKARKIRITFDWKNSVARHVSPAGTWKLPVPRGTLDKFSYMFAMMRDLGRGKRRFEYTIADGGRELRSYVLTSIANERIDTAVGTFDTVAVRRRHENSRRETTFWCARALGYLPVRIVHIERDGTPLTLRIQSLSGIEPHES